MSTKIGNITNDGGAQLLGLWLLLTTNPNFLLKPAATSVATDQDLKQPLGTTPVTLTPIDDKDTIRTLAQLSHALMLNNPSSINFDEPVLQNFLTLFLFSPNVASDGSPLPPYVYTLLDTANAFQNLFAQFASGWTYPCPRRIDEIVG